MYMWCRHVHVSHDLLLPDACSLGLLNTQMVPQCITPVVCCDVVKAMLMMLKMYWVETADERCKLARSALTKPSKLSADVL